VKCSLIDQSLHLLITVLIKKILLNIILYVQSVENHLLTKEVHLMLSFTVNVQNILIDRYSLLKEYEPEKINQLIIALTRKYKVFILGDFAQAQVMQNGKRLTNINKIEDYLLSPTSTVVITSNAKKIPEFHLRNISTILLGENLSTIISANDIYNLPDLILTFERAKAFLLHDLDFGYRNEIAVENYLEKSGNGVLTKPKGLLYVAGEIQHLLYPNVKAKLIVPGRFFSAGDTRAYADVLTLYLLKFKDEKSFAVNVFADSLKVCLSLLNQKQKVDVITTVPSRQKNNKLDSIFRTIEMQEYGNVYQSDLLKVGTMYQQQKYAGGPIDRARNVENKFVYTKTINGHVLLVDDIYTTGATTLECARILYQAGAKSVTILPFGITQQKVTTSIRNPVRDINGEVYKLRLNNNSGEPFWVSSGGNYKEFNQIRNCYFSQ
jgi:predicted amidophosphoribosyltransferase